VALIGRRNSQLTHLEAINLRMRTARRDTKPQKDSFAALLADRCSQDA
jgi:hypothetical protein